MVVSGVSGWKCRKVPLELVIDATSVPTGKGLRPNVSCSSLPDGCPCPRAVRVPCFQTHCSVLNRRCVSKPASRAVITNGCATTSAGLTASAVQAWA